MNPYTHALAALGGLGGNFEYNAVVAILTLMGEAYSSGWTRGPGNSEFDYVTREVAAKFGELNPVTKEVRRMFAGKLGR